MYDEGHLSLNVDGVYIRGCGVGSCEPTPLSLQGPRFGVLGLLSRMLEQVKCSKVL